MAMRGILLSFGCLGTCMLVLLWQASDKIFAVQTPAAGEISADQHSKQSPAGVVIEERVRQCMGAFQKGDSHDEHGHGEDHHHHYDIHDYLLGLLLIVSMVVLALIKLLTNFPNYHVRKVTWLLLHGSVSIFLAVFTWNVSRAFIEDFVIVSFHRIRQDVQKQMWVWRNFTVFIIFLMYVILTLNARIGRGMETRLHIIRDRARMKSLTNFMHTVTFLAHAAAFSSMTGWCLTLNQDGVKQSFLRAAYLLWSWFWRIIVGLAVFKGLRELFIYRCLQHHGHDHLVEDWRELLEEGETDFFSLVMSFLVSAVTVYGILGNQVIEPSGHESFESLCSHSFKDAWQALLLSFVLLVSAFFYVVMRHKCEPVPHESESQGPTVTRVKMACTGGAQLARMTKKRVSDCVESTLIMTFSWLFIYASQWFVARATVFDKPLAGGNRTCLNLMVALICMSFAAIFVIVVAYAIDHLERCSHGAGIVTSKALRKLMQGMGFLVGFTWEQAFNHAIGAISYYAADITNGQVRDASMKLVLFVVTVLVVYPTWCWYIVPQFTESGFLFGFIPRVTVGKVREVLAREDVDLPHSQKIAYLKKVVEELNEEILISERAAQLPQQGPHYTAPQPTPAVSLTATAHAPQSTPPYALPASPVTSQTHRPLLHEA